MCSKTRPIQPTILFGAFDRDNFGDLLFPHVAARLLDTENLLFAGLAERDLCGAGGYRTRAISQLVKELGEHPVNILHVGGELLTCNAWQAAVILQPSEKVQSIIQRLEGDPDARNEWIRHQMGFTALAPYALARELFRGTVWVIYTAVGGVELKERDEPFRTEVITKLKDADYVSARELQTQAYLKNFGIHCHLAPDPAVMVAELFGARIEKHAQGREVASPRAAFPDGYMACQFSADFGDDATLRQMAVQLDQLAEASGFGIVLFRAGAAPWHDDLDCYRRLVKFTKSAQVRIFESLNIWDICALIAQSRVFCGSSLHGRIVAMAFGLPRVNLNHPHKESRTGKQAAYAATWELPGIPATVDIAGIAAGVLQAIAHDEDQLHVHAQALVAKYLEEFTTVRALLDNRT